LKPKNLKKIEAALNKSQKLKNKKTASEYETIFQKSLPFSSSDFINVISIAPSKKLQVSWKNLND
jgi:hypothetical protein